MAGLSLQIDTFPYLLSTAGIVSMPTSSDSNWPSDLTLLSGALEWPRTVIRERCKPLDGDVDVTGIDQFEVHDITPSSGPASGHPVFTYLGTRSTLNLTSSLLSAPLSAIEVGSIDVVTTSGFPASGTVWIDQEAIGYASKTGTTFDTLTRGAYGSKAAAHVFDSDYGTASAVWSEFSHFEGKRAVLYYVNDANVAKVLWIGIVRDGPRLSDEGATYTFQCDHIWAYERDLRLGIQSSTCSLVGFDSSLIRTIFQIDGNSTPYGFGATSTEPYRTTLDEALIDAETVANDALATAGHNARGRIYQENGGIVYEASATLGTLPTDPKFIDLQLFVGTQYARARSVGGSDPRSTRAIITPSPETLVRLYADAELTYPVDNAATLPTSWAPVTTTDAPYSTSAQTVLVGDFDKDLMLVVETSAVDTTIVPNTITGRAYLLPLSASTEAASHRNPITLDHEVRLKAVARVTTSHWLHGLRYGIITPSTVISSGLDDRNWNFDGVDRAISLTGSGPGDRTWYFDGRRTCGDVIRDNLKFNGVGLGVRNGRVSPFLLTPPLATDSAAATFTAGNYTANTKWGRNPDGIANVVEIESPWASLTIADTLSLKRYGQGKTIKITLDGNDDPRLMRPDPRTLFDTALARIVNNFSTPTFTRQLSVSLEHMFDVFIGDYVTITDWLTPDGSGGRGPSGLTVQVIGRDIDITPGGGGTMTLEVLGYWQGTQYGIAPCAKVSAISGGQLTVATGYLAGTSTPGDYAGSDLSDYPFVANDGGTSWFAAPDRVKLRRRNVTTVIEETGFAVTSIDALNRHINVSPNPATISPAISGEWWDVVFDDYGNGASVTVHEKKFAWVGDYSTNVIGTSTDAPTRWAP